MTTALGARGTAAHAAMPARNPGTPLDLGVLDAHADQPQRGRAPRGDDAGTRRTVKKEWQAAWLLRAVTLHRPDDAVGRRHARQRAAALRQGAPARCAHDLLEALGVADLGIQVGAVCVYHALVPTAVEALRGSGIPVAAVSTGFPAGPDRRSTASSPRSSALGGRRRAARSTSSSRARHVLTGNWQALYDEVRAFREACGDAHMKAILATGELGTLRNVASASLVCMMAGADFIKTSTGKEAVNATLPVGAGDGAR